MISPVYSYHPTGNNPALPLSLFLII